ncbi:MAG TPA: LytTR family DNA-binding domain-containing protein, partial [Pyrinomonadaceae bacterium]|nr:LytTR family DNA-binding domain-containing protein [Pyrinomonadaceae bacterium]
ETNRVQIIGQTSAPLKDLQEIPTLKLDTVFLDIQMPDLNGFELLAKLKNYPPVIFTTAFDEYALRAFEVYSLDYLLKPVETERLEKALTKLERLSREPVELQNLQKMIQSIAVSFQPDATRKLERLPSRIGGKVQILDATEITHFFAEDKMTFARNSEGKQFPIDFSLNELESKLDTRYFLRIHRNAIVNINFIEEVHGWFSGKILIRLKDKSRTELVVARDRVKVLKDFLGM